MRKRKVGGEREKGKEFIFLKHTINKGEMINSKEPGIPSRYSEKIQDNIFLKALQAGKV